MKKIIFLFACLSLLISCSDDNEAPGHEIHGVWTVSQYIADMDPPPVVEEGEIIWTIDIDNKKLKVKSENSLMESGTYGITVSHGLLTIHYYDHNEELKYSFEDDMLVLQTAIENLADAPIIKLKKFQPVPEQ